MKYHNTAFTITGSGKISAFVNDKCYTVNTDHQNYDALIESLKAKDWNKFIELVDVQEKLQSYISDNIEICNGVLKYKGNIVHNSLTTRILNFMQNDLPFIPLINFLENLMLNPSKRAVDELYSFLEAGGNPITEDGCFLAFKNVRSNFKDIRSGTFDNSIGSICEMPRNMVCDNKDMTCSSGLHFCSISYLPSFSDSDGGKTVILKINPRDVVSIPSDYNNTKGRCCRYEVVAEYTENWREKIESKNNGFDYDLYDEYGNAYSDIDEEDCCCDDCEHDEAYYGIKPDGSKFYNVRDNSGKFMK